MTSKFKSNSPCCKIGSKRAGSQTPSYTLWFAAKSRAEKKGLPFTLRVSDVEEMVLAADKCPALGIPFCWSNKGIRDNSPTLDKYDPRLGYTRENTRLISALANRIKTNADSNQVGKVYVWMRRRELELELGKIAEQ